MRLALVLGLASAVFAFASTTATAEAPTHQKYTISGSFNRAAGDFCDFNFSNPWTVEINTVLFGDPNDPTTGIEVDTQFNTHINLDTGYSLTEVDHLVVHLNTQNELYTVGLVWHLRDPSGKLVVVHAGQLLIDARTGELIKATPNFDPDAAAVVCTALGGSPAI